MIDYISGTIADLSPTRVVVDNHGMGYGLEISLQTYEECETIFKRLLEIPIHD